MIGDVSGIQATAQRPTASSGGGALNYDSFLRLLVAQMQNQDPTSPADSAQYLSQLASFAAVEQTISTNAKLDQVLTSLDLSGAQALIGKTVASADGSVGGVVKSVEVVAGGATAILETGERLALRDGITIRAA
jgi:flagellar basal-body rod modification protein FlgD